MRQSHTTVLERNVCWQHDFTTEPYEVGWASEALFFVRTLSVEKLPVGVYARVQISPDGIHWCAEGSELPIASEPGVTFCRVTQFGGWLRLVGQIPDDAEVKVLVYLVLKE
ncbi:MAG: hypothetical protein KDE50_11795 [Caldilineaceae bacterium]|nr:hypothetical protein [Caldilineaceae bacterium]MCB0140582.1 hypothetical protein [Caldilineaceae bacterium]MCB9157118.1 hypothetical protein [Caldilineaceae bacterium]